MILMRCPECGRITLNMAGACNHCGGLLTDENTSPEIMTGLISSAFGLLIFILYLEIHSAPFLWTAAAFFLFGLYSVFSKQKKRLG